MSDAIRDTPNAGVIRKHSELLAALVVACLVALPASNAAAQDTELEIRQVPKDKQLQEDARDEGLESRSVPERCSDPEVAASDPACAKAGEDTEDSATELPAIQDTADDKIDLLPGVTINQSPSTGR